MQLEEARLEQEIDRQSLKLIEETDDAEGYTAPHAIPLAHLAERLGARCGLRGTDLLAVKVAALAHDWGERVMRRDYLRRARALTWEERLDLWRHPIIGEQAAAERGLSRHVQLLIRWHHEWWNGLGYPDRLSGAAIPVGARVLRVADSYCALTADRPYRERYDRGAAAALVADQAGLECDPLVVKRFLALLAEEPEVRSPEPEVEPAETPAPDPEPGAADDGLWTPDSGLLARDPD